MPQLTAHLEISRCPHCNVDQPSLIQQFTISTVAYDGHNERFWAVYKCSHCGGLVTASSNRQDGFIEECYPGQQELDEAIPGPARAFLLQAIQSMHAPAGAVMLAASAVDAMLKAKDYKIGTLCERIKKAVEDHLITDDMGKWAHQVRLDANDQRHADEEAPLPNESDAKRCIDFAKALAEFLFVLPSKVNRGLADSSPSSD